MSDEKVSPMTLQALNHFAGKCKAVCLDVTTKEITSLTDANAAIKDITDTI
jgi:hypothetical protein